MKTLVELHGGWVALESAPGEGATFTVHLPEAAVSTAAAEPELDLRAGARLGFADRYGLLFGPMYWSTKSPISVRTRVHSFRVPGPWPVCP